MSSPKWGGNITTHCLACGDEIPHTAFKSQSICVDCLKVLGDIKKLKKKNF